MTLMTDTDIALRPARPEDLPAIEELIALSGRELSRDYYSARQIDGLVRHVFGADEQLVADGTYYVCEAEGRLVAAGGWSRRRTLHGGERGRGHDPLVDPAHDAARIRAFFVHPAWARRGLARRLYMECERASRAAGFRSLVLAATLAGEPLYRSLGFTVTRRHSFRLPDGVEVGLTDMERSID